MKRIKSIILASSLLFSVAAFTACEPYDNNISENDTNYNNDIPNSTTENEESASEMNNQLFGTDSNNLNENSNPNMSTTPNNNNIREENEEEAQNNSMNNTNNMENEEATGVSYPSNRYEMK